MINPRKLFSFGSHILSATIGGCISLYLGSVQAQPPNAAIGNHVIKVSELQIVEEGSQASIRLRIEKGKPLIRIENPEDNQEIRIGMIEQAHSKGTRAGLFVKPLNTNSPLACLELDSNDETSLSMGEPLSNSQLRLRAGSSLWPGGPNCQIQLGSLTSGHFLAETGEAKAQVFVNHLMSGIKLEADKSQLPKISRELRGNRKKKQGVLFN